MYWKQQLDGITFLRLPTDFPRAHTKSAEGSSLFFEFPPGKIYYSCWNVIPAIRVGQGC